MNPQPLFIATLAATAVGLLFTGLTRRRSPLLDLLDDYHAHLAATPGPRPPAGAEHLPGRRSLTGWAQHHARRAGWPLRPTEIGAVWLGATVGLALVAWIGIGNILIAVPFAAALAFGGLYALAQARALARLRKIDSQLGPALSIIANLLAARRSLPQAIEHVATQTPAPLGIELEWIARRHSVGVDLVDALREVGERVDSDEFRFFVVAADYTRTTGGDLADILHGLVETLTERLRLRGELKTQLAEAQATKYALAAAPGVLLGGLTLVSPEHLDPLFNTGSGRLMLLAALVLWAAGVAWSTLLVNRVRI